MAVRASPLLLLTVALMSGCNQRRAVRLERVTEVTLFDAGDASHPSPRDARWSLTNMEVVAEILPVTSKGDVPMPECPAVAGILTINAQGQTNHYFMTHIHFANAIRLDGVGVVTNGNAVLRQFAQVGVPTNKLFAVPGEH